MFDFINFSWIDILDVVAVSFLAYQFYRLIRGTVAVNVFIGLLLFYLFWKLVTALQMALLGEIVGKFMEVGVLATIIIFQQEIRRFLMLVGTTKFTDKLFFGKRDKSILKSELNIPALCQACFSMATSYTGALIVLKHKGTHLKETSAGDWQDIVVTPSILESIFYKNSPLHDGAVVIDKNKIIATRVILPVSYNKSLPENYGLRHRAALGITEKSDACCIVVSEERGEVIFIKGDTLKHIRSTKELEETIIEEFLI